MVPVLPLSPSTLAHHARRVGVPRYDRDRLTPGVVHMSVGSFHRSHQAVYFDDLATLGHKDWGLVGVGLRRPEMRRALTRQAGLYTVVSRGSNEARARVIGAITRYLYAPDQREAVLRALADERTAVVTLTITNAAYGVDAADPSEDGQPKSALSYLVEALDRRRRAGHDPFTVLSCDNLPENGGIARDALTSCARRRDPGLADWIAERAAFPSSMVDRITPRTTLAHHDFVQREFGVFDRWPVLTEPFSQWVMEDRFSSRRPPLEEVGVQLVPDVRPYSLIKTRLLNATHCAIGYLGTLAGLRRTDEVLHDPLFRDYVGGLMDHEVTPILPPVPGIDLTAYKRTLLERLGNPEIRDSLARLCRAGSAKMPAHVISSLVDARTRGIPHPLLTLAVAGWFLHLRTSEVIDDPLADRLRQLARAGGADPRPLLRERKLFGALADDPGFAAELGSAIDRLERRGVRGALAGSLADAALIPA